MESFLIHGGLPCVSEGSQVTSKRAALFTDRFPEVSREVVVQHAAVAEDEEEKQHSVAMAPVAAFLVICNHCCHLCIYRMIFIN